MAKPRKMCHDKIPHQNLCLKQRVMMMKDGRTRAINPKGTTWLNGSTLTISFIGGTPKQRDMVKDTAPEWTKHANLNFEFINRRNANIRISFDETDGAWSYVGNYNSNIPIHAATMNLGWQDEGVILHEFGHMIGLAHEHSSPLGGFQWNEEVVIRDLAGAPNYWDEATVRHNVLNKYSVDQINGTEFDENSIMLYAFPNEWTIDDFETHENNTLSALDKSFVKSKEMYPPDDNPEPFKLPVLESVPAEISKAGEVDVFQFEVVDPGQYTIQTMGSSDVVMQLFGPDDQTNLISEDDDGGSGRNSLISAALEKGTYYAQVRHYGEESTGKYQIMVNR